MRIHYLLVIPVEISETGAMSQSMMSMTVDDVQSTSARSYSPSPTITPLLWLDDDSEPDGTFSSTSTSSREEDSSSHDYLEFENNISSFVFDESPLDQSSTLAKPRGDDDETEITESTNTPV